MGSTSNPWYVPRIEDFQFFCCPECDIKVKDSQDFINHALALHEQAKDSPFIKLDVKVEDTKEDEVILLPNLRKRKADEPAVTISIVKRRHEDFDDNNSDVEDAKDKTKDVNGQIEDCGDTVSKLEKHEDNRTSDADFVLEDIHDDDFSEESSVFLCMMCEEVSSSEKELVKHMTQKHQIEEETRKRKNPNESQVTQKIVTQIKPEDESIDVGKSKDGPTKSEPLKVEKQPKKFDKKQKNSEFNKEKCDTCDITFKNRRMRYHHFTKFHPDEIKRKVTTFEKDPIKFNKRKSIIKNLRCDTCDIKFDNRHKALYHFQKHHDDQVTCEICGYVANKHNMHIHRKRIHHLDTITTNKLNKKCDKCDTDFKVAEDMDNHLRESHNCDKQFECKDCDKTWVSHLSLELHYVEVHEKIMYSCDICGYTVNEVAPLKRHQRSVHQGNRGNVCHVCGRSFHRPNLLVQHLAVQHDIGEAKFKCDFCNKRFLNNASLKNHVEGAHLKNVKYNCDQCSHSSNTIAALGKHKRYAHSKKN